MNALALNRRDTRILTPGPTPVMQTERLTLRPHRLSDADAMTETLSDFAVTRMLARVPTPYDRQDALDWLVQHTAGLDTGWELAVTEKDDVHIGMVGIDLRHGRWHLGYWLNRYYWRRGIMGEAVGAALERFARRMPDVAVFSGIFADNQASLKMQQKLGFEIIGCSEVYSFARNTMVPHIETVLKPGALRLPRAA
ncbi:GNAT family N-acetyltransferase [Rhizobium sp. ICMP 5592]|uniref:GNAT family N-acetyltransferase n=1 Tax=Rhizobium sp. ICMP 5592 TaxID=2292445 RepID=UPI0012958125|nr:GNAT family N-acetyltransferase [Rhizobium sp. ICMP 5592]MQB45519.1 N-acetyltransferase [Rhizobium sp. ICMP 5592]